MKGNELIFNEGRQLNGNKSWRLICTLVAILFFVASAVNTGAVGALTVIPFFGLFAYGLDGLTQRLRWNIKLYMFLAISCTVISIHGYIHDGKNKILHPVVGSVFTLNGNWEVMTNPPAITGKGLVLQEDMDRRLDALVQITPEIHEASELNAVIGESEFKVNAVKFHYVQATAHPYLEVESIKTGKTYTLAEFDTNLETDWASMGIDTSVTPIESKWTVILTKIAMLPFALFYFL